MDREQQVRLNFLGEAETRLDSMESIFLGLATHGIELQRLDEALRAAHSVKGGAGMMGFAPLSQVSHSLEDFLKILRVRNQPEEMDTELETLLLQGVDCLRQLCQLHRQGTVVEETWLANHTQPLFARLRQRLGDLRPEDEDALLAQEENVDVSLLMFESGVEEALQSLESKLGTLSGAALAEELQITAQELAAFGRIRDLDRFVQLCESVSSQLSLLSPANYPALAQQAIKDWRRSQALVLLGRTEQLPSQFTFFDAGLDLGVEPEFDLFEALDGLDLTQVYSEMEGVDFTDLEPELLAVDLPDIAEINDLLDLGDLQAAISDLDLEALATDFNLSIQELEPSPAALSIPMPISPLEPSPKRVATPVSALDSSSQMVRVPAEQLQRLNLLFSALILERNTVNLRLSQHQNLMALLRERMYRLEQSNTHLRKWDDQASGAGIVPRPAVSPALMPELMAAPHPTSPLAQYQEQFDFLELDRYNDLHLISQEQIETLVQLQEVSTDLELSLRDINQAVRELNQTSRSMQSNVTQMQMRPFSDVVGRFPRIVRDWSVQFGKAVDLKIEGAATLCDRTALDALSDPIMHLLRNAFDHGIEDSATRIAAGKSPRGTILLQSRHQGNQTLMIVSDDGQGIDLTKVCDRARKLGIPEQILTEASDRALLELIFEPGFSTAEQVTEISGRGVGMDVVRTNLQQVRGDIQVETQVGVGTTFTISFPFTLSILSVMLLESAGMVFAVPLESIQEMIRFSPSQVEMVAGQEHVSWQDLSIPLIRLIDGLAFSRPCKRFVMEGAPSISQPTVLVVEQGKQVRGLLIDRVWGEQEVAIRPILSPVALPPGFVSATILGDGRVVPLIDPLLLAEGLLKGFSQDQNRKLEDSLPLGQGFQNSLGGSAAEDTVLAEDTILVVDDSINMRRYLALILERAGYQVEQAKDGQEAVDKLLGGLSVRAIICDIEMPRLDGYGVLTELRSRTDFQDLPIAILTSRSSDKHRKLAMNLGASAYFSKPCTDQELLQYLQALLKK
jgi:two-component system, chemotaxis family, sensor histidine kinase and response regulator PixL